MSVQISIYIDGTESAMRNWEYIPSLGDYIKLGGKLEGWYLITEVNWHGDSYPIVTLHVEKKE